jgi:ABC-2 type transport system ATP-binding protein
VRCCGPDRAKGANELIEAVGLSRRFGSITAVEDLDLTIPDGEVFGFLGPNGAGKTTTIRMLCGLISCSSGRATIEGHDVGTREGRTRALEIIGLLPEAPGLYESLSAEANLDFFGKLHSMPADRRAARIEELLRRLDIWERRSEAVSGFSKGMKQKIAIARSLIHEPKYLFLDEPTSGLDPAAAHTVRSYLMELKTEGRTIFINTHNLDDAERLCDRIGIMRTRLLALGEPQKLMRSYFGQATSFEGRGLEPALAQVRAIPGIMDAHMEEGRLLVISSDPEAINPEVTRALVASGAQITYAHEVRRNLEDLYMKVIGGGR